jgi:RimJ/RimL family protein N-acetyltransferase
MKIIANEARQYFLHPSQNKSELDPAELHDAGIEYRAEDGVCLAFHGSMWPDVWSVHIGTTPDMWGRLDAIVMRLLRGFFAEMKALRIVAWVPRANCAVHALARRVGFVIDGVLPLADNEITMIGWAE